MKHSKEEIIKAFEKSIDKWYGIVNEGKEDKGSDDCALCELFEHNQSYEDKCKSCPIFKDTGVGGCLCTPYSDWAKLFYNKWPRAVNNGSQLEAAEKELDYLKRLFAKYQRKVRNDV